MGEWRQYQTTRPTWDEVHDWLSTGDYTGIGVICGAVSGELELIEIEGPEDDAVTRLGRVMAAARRFDMESLVTRVLHGCVVRSAGGGLHLFVRLSDGEVAGNTKLASRPTTAAEREAKPGERIKVVAETRGFGGFVIVAPTPGRNGHAEGSAYLFAAGASPANIAMVTAEELAEIHMLMTEALHETAPEEMEQAPRVERVTPAVHLAPVTDSVFGAYRAAVTWRDILTPANWTEAFTASDGRTHWVRPGKTVHEGVSATSLEDGPLYVFSTSTEFPSEKGMSKEYVYAALHHSGDLTAASGALRALGYGPVGLGVSDLPPWTPSDAVALAVAIAGDPDVEPTPYEAAVGRKYAELRVMDDARGMLATLKAGKAPALTAISLAELLTQPDEAARYRVADLWPAEGRVMLAAAAKAGKTTLVAANLIPALVDGRPFLGRYEAAKVAGRVVLLNMEVGANTIRRWMRDCRIERTGAVTIANLRGNAAALSLASPEGRKRFGEFLKRAEAEIVILDPLAPVLASLGLDENSNADVSLFYSWWSEALTMAGVLDDLIVHHTGHAGQRSRGASRLLDEPDAIWTLTREEEEEEGFASIDPVRFIAAYGRDVELSAESMMYTSGSRGLTLTGLGRAEVKGSKDAAIILMAFADGRPRTRNQICTDSGVNRNKCWDLLVKMVDSGQLREVGKSSNGHPTLLPADPIERL